MMITYSITVAITAVIVIFTTVTVIIVVVAAAIEIKQLCGKRGVGDLFLAAVSTSILTDAFNEFSCRPITFKLCHVRKAFLDLRAVH